MQQLSLLGPDDGSQPLGAMGAARHPTTAGAQLVSLAPPPQHPAATDEANDANDAPHL